MEELSIAIHRPIDYIESIVRHKSKESSNVDAWINEVYFKYKSIIGNDNALSNVCTMLPFQS
jgi:hypothetical protein